MRKARTTGPMAPSIIPKATHSVRTLEKRNEVGMCKVSKIAKSKNAI